MGPIGDRGNPKAGQFYWRLNVGDLVRELADKLEQLAHAEKTTVQVGGWAGRLPGRAAAIDHEEPSQAGGPPGDPQHTVIACTRLERKLVTRQEQEQIEYQPTGCTGGQFQETRF